jgi:tRNA nucleotidyltransferase (CCA-adding enzyme)
VSASGTEAPPEAAPKVTPEAPPALVTELARACDAAGGRAYLVGGCVRDALLGRPVKDWDVEVHQLPEERLLRLLRGLGSVDAVGRAFAVFKLTRGGLTIDVSLPRRDSNVGPGHRGIAVHGDPFLGVREAARRRDLTVNAVLADALTGELVDPFGGLDDLRERRLRAVDADTFLEDPLRALRVVQFAARLGFHVDPSLVDLCRAASLEELPAERVRDEWFKLLLAPSPSRGFEVARSTALLERVFPEVAGLIPDEALDRLVPLADGLGPEGRRLAVGLLTWLADAPSAHAATTLERLGLGRWGGYALRDRTLAAHAALAHPMATEADLRRLATRAEPVLVLSARAARGDPGALAALDRATALGVREEPPAPLLRGRDLLQHGLRPGPTLGALLDAVYAAQLAGDIHTADEALALALRAAPPDDRAPA